MQLEFLKNLLYLMAVAVLIASTCRILKEYERAVIFRLGKLRDTKGPGLVFLIPLVDRMHRIDLRLVSIDVPRQDIMTRDNVPVTVDAVVYFNITDPARAITRIQNIYQSTFLIAQATLRNVLGQAELDDLLSQQAKINQQLQQIIAVNTGHWGISIPIVEIKEVTLPEEMKRAMAKQAETERERRALLIDAQGEYQAAKTLAKAGQILSGNPQSLQLRYLQTLRHISTQQGSTILFPLPLDLISPFVNGIKGLRPRSEEGTAMSMGLDVGLDKAIGMDTNVGTNMREDEAAATAISGLSGNFSDGPIRQDTADISPKMPNVNPKMPNVSDLSGSFSLHESAPLRQQSPLKQPPPLKQPSPQKVLLTQYQQKWRSGRLRPQFVQWLSTNRCQFRCTHCETTAGQASPGELTTSEVKKIIDDLADLGCEFFSITGGEPLLRPDIFLLARHAHERGMKVGLTTNGQATEENLLAFEQARFDSLIITLDGCQGTQDRLRGCPGSYERGIRTIEFYHDLGAPFIGVSTTLLEENIRDLPQLTDEVFRAGAHQLQLQPLLFQHGRPSRNSPETVKNAFRFILEARGRGVAVEPSESFGYLGPLEPLIRTNPFFCGCGWNTFCLTHEGEVSGCAVPVLSGQTEGNIRDGSLKKIWEQEFGNFRRNLPAGLSNTCRQCPHLSLCRGGCWLFRAQGLNPCFLPEAEQVEVFYALYPQTAEGKTQVLP
ncbi:MAG: SPFH domain-containing protein [bacterium]